MIRSARRGPLPTSASRPPRRRRHALWFFVLLALLAAPRPARAVEITVFLTGSYPRQNWSYGAGADLSFSFLKVGGFGVELARQRSPDTDRGMTYLTGHVMLMLPIKKVRLYGGLGSGLFYQGRGLFEDADFGSLNALIFGAKVRLADLLVLKAEYRRIGLTGGPPLALDDRWSVGGGIAF